MVECSICDRFECACGGVLKGEVHPNILPYIRIAAAAKQFIDFDNYSIFDFIPKLRRVIKSCNSLNNHQNAVLDRFKD